jgi:hypothetical protein
MSAFGSSTPSTSDLSKAVTSKPSKPSKPSKSSKSALFAFSQTGIGKPISRFSSYINEYVSFPFSSQELPLLSLIQAVCQVLLDLIFCLLGRCFSYDNLIIVLTAIGIVNTATIPTWKFTVVTKFSTFTGWLYVPGSNLFE